MPVSVKIGGTWKTATAVFNKVGGVWKTASDMPVKIAGVWKTGILNNSSYDSIATLTPSGVSTVTFSSIPSTYKSLQLRILARDGFTSQLYIRFNNDSGSNYAWHRLAGDGSAASASSGTSFDRIQRIGYIGGATYFAANIIDIIDYASTSKNKTVRSFNGYNQNDTANGIVNLESGLWMSTAAINSITIADENGNSFASGSSIALYGIKG